MPASTLSDFGSKTARSENRTSADVNGVPSDQVTPGRRWSVCTRPSSLDSHFSASHGSSSNVARFTRTRRPCVSWVRSSVAWSRATSRLNDRGSARMEATICAATAWRRVPFNSGRIARFASQQEPDREGKHRSTQNGPNERSFYLQILDAPVNLLAASETVQISAQNRAMPNTAALPAPRRLKRPSVWPPAGSLDAQSQVRCRS